jgi:catalase-peroxidase
MHCDMGMVHATWGSKVPEEELLWQDPIFAVNQALIDESDIAALRQKYWNRD